jgi:hypothetical protein
MADISITKAELRASISDGSFPAKIPDLEFNTLKNIGALMADLHNEGSQDIVSYFEKLDWDTLSNRDQTRMAHVIEGFATSVKDTSERIIPFFHIMHARVSSHNAYHVDKGFESWMSANRSQISEVVVLIKCGNQDSPFLGKMLHIWREAVPVDALNAAIAFSQDKRPDIKRQAILALSAFNCADEEEAVLVETRLVELASSSIVDDQRVAIAAMGRMLEKQYNKSTRLVAALEKAADQPSAEIRHELIASITYARDAYPLPLRDKVLALMKTVQSDCGETLNLIDLALYNMDTDKDREAIFETLTAILGQETGAPALKAFDSLVHKVGAGADELAGWYAARWLLDGRYRICSQLNSFFPPLDKSVYDFGLNALSLSNADIFYLARKIFVYLMFSHGPAVSLMCACLASLDLKERKLLERDIVAFWLRNYPSDLDLFEAAYNAYPRNGLKASIGRMRQQVNAYEKPLRALPSNPALRPSTMERRTQAEISHERNREISRAAEESSLFASLFHKSTLLYGRSSITYIYPTGSDEPIRQVIPMQSFSTSSALPRMDILYPTRLNYLLYQFRREKRPE